MTGRAVWDVHTRLALGAQLDVQRVEHPLEQLDGVALRGNHEPLVRVELDGLAGGVSAAHR